MVIYSLKPSTEGRWSVCRSGVSLFSDLRLVAAIRLAREVASDEHFRSGRTVYVEMPGPESAIRLAQYVTTPPLPGRAGAIRGDAAACMHRAG